MPLWEAGLLYIQKLIKMFLQHHLDTLLYKIYNGALGTTVKVTDQKNAQTRARLLKH